MTGIMVWTVIEIIYASWAVELTEIEIIYVSWVAELTEIEIILGNYIPVGVNKYREWLITLYKII